MTQKPHRTSFSANVIFNQENQMERKMSDLLPGDLISQFSIDPDDFLFKRDQNTAMRRRATDSFFGQFDLMPPSSRRASLFENGKSNINSPFDINPSNQMISCFQVELSDCTVDAFSSRTVST